MEYEKNPAGCDVGLIRTSDVCPGVQLIGAGSDAAFPLMASVNVTVPVAVVLPGQVSVTIDGLPFAEALLANIGMLTTVTSATSSEQRIIRPTLVCTITPQI